MIKVEISGSSKISSAEVLKIIRRALKAAGIKDAYVSVAFITSEEIKKWNRLYRKKARATDILSFGFNRAMGDEKKWKRAGELLICEAAAKINAKEKRHSLKKEIGTLLVHGSLHLVGYDHEGEREAKTMFALQNKIIMKLK
ncbi:rRNA maturation RNase YbeY [Candidatus Uhrbacteria bacterium]|nr:rRNA maturation RNase YbeY [Candidatus Uhrbacteria bacterium]